MRHFGTRLLGIGSIHSLERRQEHRASFLLIPLLNDFMGGRIILKLSPITIEELD